MSLRLIGHLTGSSQSQNEGTGATPYEWEGRNAKHAVRWRSFVHDVSVGWGLPPHNEVVNWVIRASAGAGWGE